MPILADYQHFSGRHHETGTVHNHLASRGIRAPHSGKPYSEALLLGISGGIAMGYFTFAYKGYDPHVALLTRNTFSPLDTLLTRLGVDREFRRSNWADKGRNNLIDQLEDGVPAMVWADMWSLPYNALPFDDGMWGSFPILVYGYDPASGEALIADRAAVGLNTTTDALDVARARIKKDKFQILHLDIPDPDRLPAAVRAGLWDCIKLFTEKPPRGATKNFGLAAYQNWIQLLTQPKQRQSWQKEFPAGTKLFAGLTSSFDRLSCTGIAGDGNRSDYAAFLDEAASILDQPELKEIAILFRNSSQLWEDLGLALLPDTVPDLKAARLALTMRRESFIKFGNDAMTTMQEADQKLTVARNNINQSLPFSDREVAELQNSIATCLQQIHDIEKKAVTALRTILGKQKTQS